MGGLELPPSQRHDCSFFFLGALHSDHSEPPRTIRNHWEHLRTSPCCLQALDFQLPGGDGFKVPYPPITARTFSKGGAPAFFSPEVSGAVASVGGFIDYDGNDAWAAAYLAYKMLSRQDPFTDVADPRSFTDAAFRPLPEEYSPTLGEVVARMLRVAPGTGFHWIQL